MPHKFAHNAAAMAFHGLLNGARNIGHVMARHRRFHEPYLAGNRELYASLAAGDLDAAEQRLSDYLDAAERQLTGAFATVVS